MNKQNRPPRLFSPKLVIGLVVIAIGFILLGENLRLYDAWHLLSWWPLALAALGLAKLIQDGPLSLRAHVWLALSVAGFLHQFGPWGLLERWWPGFLVWAGIIVTLRALFATPKATPMPPSAPLAPTPAISCDPDSAATQVKP